MISAGVCAEIANIPTPITELDRSFIARAIADFIQVLEQSQTLVVRLEYAGVLKGEK